MSEDSRARFRLHFHKTGDIRYIGHLDLHRSLERTLRRANLPLDYSKGFNPRVKLNLSTALPLGCSSTAELADFWLQSELQQKTIFNAIMTSAPPGISVIAVEQVDLKLPSLQASIESATYQVTGLDDLDQAQIEEKIQETLQADQLVRIRRGKEYDLRPLILSLEWIKQAADPPFLKMVLSAGEGKTGRPEEVLLQLGLDPVEAMIERTELLLID